MPIGKLNTEADLQAFIKQVLDQQPQRPPSGFYEGKGSPENVVAANEGACYRNLLGGAGTTWYVKEAGGSGNTGWMGK